MGQFLVSTVDRVLLVPKLKRSFTNTEDWEFTFEAGVPVVIGDNVADGEIPMEVAKTYSESYPHVFSITSDGKAKALPETEEPEKTLPDGEFDAVAFLASNLEPTEKGLAALKQKELLAICEVLELSGSPNDSKKILAAKIVQEIKVRSEAIDNGE